MCNIKRIPKIIYSIAIIIEIILFTLLCIKNPFPKYMIDYVGLFKNLAFAILIFFIISIICYLFEHKKYNKNE